jgi:hypothetical protein
MWVVTSFDAGMHAAAENRIRLFDVRVVQLRDGKIRLHDYAIPIGAR